MRRSACWPKARRRKSLPPRMPVMSRCGSRSSRKPISRWSRGSMIARRQFLHLTAGAVATPAVWRSARAETYPSRPVRLIIGYLPGGSADMTARLFGQWLSDRLGQQDLVESRARASTNIATEAVVRAAPDGYTLLLASPANATNAALYDKLNFEFLRDVVPIAGQIRFADVVVVNPSLPVKTIPELIAYAKAN